MVREELVGKALLFDSLLSGNAAQREFHRSVIKNGKKFVALLLSDRITFIPGHYAVAPREQVQSLDQKQTVPVSAVDRTLGECCGAALNPGNPLYPEVDAYYLAYCILSGDRPSVHHQRRTYWLLRE